MATPHLLLFDVTALRATGAEHVPETLEAELPLA